jgi:hypothetical protein
MNPDQIFEHEMLEFRMRMLQAEIAMNAMIAENNRRVLVFQHPKYSEKDYMDLIEKYRIHDNAFPSYRGAS